MLTRWNDFGLGGPDWPWTPLSALRRDMDRLFTDYERGWPGETRRGAGGVWPRVSMYDAGSELRLRAEVPGLSEKDLDVSIQQGSLTLKGQRTTEAPEGYAVHRQERGALSFARSFTLPCRVDVEKVSARLKDGVLEMSLPKAAEERPRQIQVQGS